MTKMGLRPGKFSVWFKDWNTAKSVYTNRRSKFLSNVTRYETMPRDSFWDHVKPRKVKIPVLSYVLMYFCVFRDPGESCRHFCSNWHCENRITLSAIRQMEIHAVKFSVWLNDGNIVKLDDTNHWFSDFWGPPHWSWVEVYFFFFHQGWGGVWACCLILRGRSPLPLRSPPVALEQSTAG